VAQEFGLHTKITGGQRIDLFGARIEQLPAIWNLYVGGNGGFTPRHAQLLAQDLDTDTLVRTIDRFLMYYVRTADRLQRTANWLEEVEGGPRRAATPVLLGIPVRRQ
jgi:NAD(P)H-nitrite reductase large subunit